MSIKLPEMKVVVYAHLVDVAAKLDLWLYDNEIEEIARSLEVADGRTSEDAPKLKAMADALRLWKTSA